MDIHNEDDREHHPERNSNTEYLPTKCRITRPPPPKPATNPLQFIKVAPCPLYRKAQEQLKKVEEIKTTRQHVREEAEDWQQNLDNWKSSRRKRVEHIIERVVEVKKFEQQEHENTKRKSKTFSEIVEERSKGRPKFTIPIYEDDPNDLSDYGIGSNSSKANSVKDVDTDDSSSLLDDKDQGIFDSSSSKEANASSNQSQSEDETSHARTEATKSVPSTKSESYTNLYSSLSNNHESNGTNGRSAFYKLYNKPELEEPKLDKEEYTYEGAIQDYRSRIKSKINLGESIFNKKPEKKPELKGQIFHKRKEIFEIDKPLEIHHYESGSAKRLSEDFVNSQSIKERLQNFEKCVEQQQKSHSNFTKTTTTSAASLQTFDKPTDRKNDNNNSNKRNEDNGRVTTYEIQERATSPETELYMNKLNEFNNDLDNLMCGKPTHSSRNELDDVGSNCNYSSSDREDSGIHTADVSCSVSQADEPIEYSDLSANTIPSCIEKLTIRKEHEGIDPPKEIEAYVYSLETRHTPEGSRGSDLPDTHYEFTKEQLIKETESFLEDARLDSTQNQTKPEEKKATLPKIIEKPKVVKNETTFPLDFDIYANPDFLVAPPKVIEPPKAKPPPPPPPDDAEENRPEPNLQRLNSTKRIKKEINLKRSSFLGLGDSYEDPELTFEKPPDINSFLQKESRFEKSLYKKMLGNLEGGLSKVESQDSGLDIERGRLSSDTWCSSIGDSSTVSHNHGQDSEHANSLTSEEEEIMKKEREIIELVEKEEKSRDKSDFRSSHHKLYYLPPQHNSDQDSEVLRVEHELLQLEKEQLKHQRRDNNFLFQTRAKNQNRRSLENICDSYETDRNYRKSMPELQIVNKEFCKTITDIPQVDQLQYRKSMPDIQQAYYKSTADYRKTVPENNLDVPLQHRKSLPELKSEFQKSAFYSPQMQFWQPIMPEKPLRAQRSRETDFASPKHSRNGIPGLNAPPKIIPNDNWLHPRQAVDAKTYSQHWLYQEAELRRLSEQQANANRNRSRQDKPLPDSVIKSLTQRVQNKARMENSVSNKQQHSFLKPHVQQLDHALPMSYRSPLNTEESQDRMLSVSGKKKCSYCGNELGRGAAMIIESLCLFYHMDCFKCCVCHVQLGDGLMGTDVRVRNQKLHCHNCYSSDDGVKFSCV